MNILDIIAKKRDKKILNKEVLYPEVEYGKIPELEKVHQSEYRWIGYDNPDYILESITGDFKGLYKQIREIMEKING